MQARLNWISPKRRAADDVVIADEGGVGAVWWATIDVTLKPCAAARMTRGEAVAVAGLPEGLRGTLKRTGLTRAELTIKGDDPDAIFDALVRVDGEAAERLHRAARAGGLE